jgi:hypothetical protein
MLVVGMVHIQMLFLSSLLHFSPSCEHFGGLLRLENCRTFVNRINKEIPLLWCLLLHGSEKPFLQVPCLLGDKMLEKNGRSRETGWSTQMC